MAGNKFFRLFFSLLGMMFGVSVSYFILFIFNTIPQLPKLTDRIEYGVIGFSVLAGGVLFFMIAPMVQRIGSAIVQELDQALKKVPVRVFVCGSIGLLAGLLAAFLISQLWAGLAVPGLRVALSVVVYAMMAYLGTSLTARKSDELTMGLKALNGSRGTRLQKGSKTKAGMNSPKILDTSVIIDGRIADIMKTGFIEGQIVIPEFVLVELRHIADSANPLKRKRGRRGLDVLNRIQEQYGVEIYNTDHEKRLKDIREVDVKLLELADILNGKVVTNDFNLNKVAAIKGVEVLNINELANTLKPVVLPGEEMRITPISAGKEAGQALAYLDDGTMIVVEDGVDSIGTELSVTVTSVLQTAAGRMIFVRKG